jgi:hypothetical protein
MLTSPEINAMYMRARGLIQIDLPDRLWEGGTSAFKIAVDKIRSNQEQLSHMLLEVSRERLLIRRLQRSVKSMLAAGVKSSEVAWLPELPNMLAVDEHEEEMSLLWDNLKLFHSELSRARSDLRSKMHLLEIETRMGPSGVISEGISGLPSAGVHTIANEHDVEWDTLQGEGPENEGDK